MDPITHTFTGAALGRAGLKRGSALATPTLVLAANAPDVDVIAYLDGPFAALAVRRGLTHGLPAMAVLPFVVAGLVLAWDRWVRRRGRPKAAPARPGVTLALAAAGVWTHPVLDWMNTYGMRWLGPFSDRWSYGDALFIVDPWIWLLLGGALFLARPPGGAWTAGWSLFGLLATALVVGAPVPAAAKGVWLAGLTAVALVELRRPRARVDGDRGGAGRPGRRVRVAGAAAGLYVCLMVTSDVAAGARVRDAARSAGIREVREIMVAPLPADPLGGDVVVATGNGYVTGSHRWLRRPAVLLDPGRPLPRRSGAGLAPDEVERAVEGAARDRRVGDFLRWSRFPRWRVRPRSSGGYRVRVDDVRYPDTETLGGLTVELDADFRPVEGGGGHR